MNENSKKTILLVEDEVLIAMTEKMQLEKYGYSVHHVNTGEKAVQTIVDGTHPVDLILMDINLGSGIDGTKAAEQILNHKDIPVVFLSSHTEPEVVEKTETITSYGYVVKGSSITVLDASIKMAFRLFRTNKEKNETIRLLEDAEKIAREREEHTRYILKHDPNAIAVFDDQMNVLIASDRFLKDYNVEDKDIIGKNHYEVFPDIPERWRDVHRRALQGEVLRNDDDFFIRLDGSITYSRWECRPWYRSDNRIGGMIAYTEVTTERKQAEEAIRLSEEYLSATLRSIGDGVIACDRNGKVASLNGAAECLTGWTTAEAVGRPLEEVFHIINAQTRKPADDPVARALREGMVVGLANHTVLIARNGTEYQIADSCAPISVDSGEVMGAVLVFRDVTEEYQLRDDLQQSEQRLRQVIDLVPHFIFAKDVQGTYLLANKAVADVYGTTPENLTGKNDYDFSSNPEEVDFFVACDRKVIESGTGLYNIEEPITDSEGSIRYLETTKIPFTTAGNGTPAVLAVSADITARKRAEETVREREALLTDILESTLSGYWDWNLVDNTEYLSPTFKRMFGYEDHEMESSPEAWQRIIFSEDLPGVYDTFDKHVKSRGHVPFDNDVRYHHRDGSAVWVKCIGRVTEWAEDGSPIRMVGCHVDITERKKALDELKTKNDLLERIFQNNTDLIALTDLGGNYTVVSIAHGILGYDTEELIGKNVMDFIHPDDFLDISSQFAEFLKTPDRNRKVVYRNRRSDGAYLWFETTGTILKDVYGNPEQILFNTRDITERKQAEQEIQRQLAEKETLLQEVHHRIKNNMAQVESLLSLQASSTDNAEVESALNEAMSRVRSTRTLYEKLLVGKGHQEVSMKDYLESLIESHIEVYNDHPGVSIEKNIVDFSLTAKKAIPIGIIVNELLTNVFKYAFDGRAEGRVLIKLEKSGSRATLTVKDDGIGFDSRVVASKSTGFGLTLTEMLAEQLEGTFTIENVNGTRSVLEFET